MSALFRAISGIPLSQQRITCGKAASPLSRVVAPRIGATAHGTPGSISTFAGRPCTITRPRVLVTTAAAEGSTGGAAGKSSKMNRRRGPGIPSSSSRDYSRGRAAGSDHNRRDAAQTRSQATGHHFQRPLRQSKPGRSSNIISDDLKACTSVAQLQQLVQQDGPAMSYVNLAAAIVMLQRILSKLSSRQQQQVTQTADNLFGQLWQLQQPKLPQCKARQLANMIYSGSMLPKTLQQRGVVTEYLLPAFTQQLSSAIPQQVSNVLYGMAASGQQFPQQSTQLLIDRLVAVLLDANPQDIANAIWAVAKMQQQVQSMQLQQLLDAFCAVAQTAKPQEIANTLWAVATMQQQVQPTQLQQLLDAFCVVAQKAVPQNIANTLWAVAKMQQQVQPMQLQQLLDALCANAEKAMPQVIANTLWAVATMQKQMQPMQLQQLLDALCANAEKAMPQAIANTLWAVATMQKQMQPMQLQQLLDAFCAVAQKAKPQEIKDTLWAVATMSQQVQPAHLQQLVDAFCAITQKAKPQEIANTLWAVAKMQQQVEQGQLEQLLCALVMQLSEAVPQDVSNTLLACAEFRYLPKQLLTATGLIDKLATANPQQLANTAWACGQLGHRDEQLMSALLNRVLDLVGNSEKHVISSGVVAQNLANLCWSLAVLDMREHASTVLTLVQAAKALWATMVPENLSQLYQVHMWLTDHNLAGGQGLAGVLTAQQLQQCWSTRQTQLDRSAKTEPGSFHQSVFRTFKHIPITELSWLVPPAMEQVSLGADGQPDGAALIDITARTADGVWLAVEADGPTHFRRPDGALMGTTQYRSRALAVKGYVLITVPYYEWRIQRSAKQKQQYLLDKVTAALQQAVVNKQRPQLGEIAQ